MKVNLMCGDCLELMKNIPDGSVDMVLCDLPYGTTDNKWDIALPFSKLWEQYNRITKPNSAIVLHADEPFSNQLINSNPNLFRYKWIWDKGRGSNFQNAKKQPMKCHEDILVFYKKSPKYNPQYWYSKPYHCNGGERSNAISGIISDLGKRRSETISADGKRYPLSIIRVKRDSSRIHPTQKPVPLLEYLIKTYTNEGDLVLDNCMGSGSTGVACVNTGRDFIGIELDQHYFDVAQERINTACADKEEHHEN